MNVPVWTSREGLEAFPNLPGVSRGGPPLRTLQGNNFSKCPPIFWPRHLPRRAWCSEPLVGVGVRPDLVQFDTWPTHGLPLHGLYMTQYQAMFLDQRQSALQWPTPANAGQTTPGCRGEIRAECHSAARAINRGHVSSDGNESSWKSCRSSGRWRRQRPGCTH
jgi:hypothetical protein